MAGIRTCDRESQVQRPNHYTTEPPELRESVYNLESLDYNVVMTFRFNNLITV